MEARSTEPGLAAYLPRPWTDARAGSKFQIFEQARKEKIATDQTTFSKLFSVLTRGAVSVSIRVK